MTTGIHRLTLATDGRVWLCCVVVVGGTVELIHLCTSRTSFLYCFCFCFSSLLFFYCSVGNSFLCSLPFILSRRSQSNGRRLICWSRHSNHFNCFLFSSPPSVLLLAYLPMRHRTHHQAILLAFILTLLGQALTAPSPLGSSTTTFYRRQAPGNAFTQTVVTQTVQTTETFVLSLFWMCVLS